MFRTLNLKKARKHAGFECGFVFCSVNWKNTVAKLDELAHQQKNDPPVFLMEKNFF